MNLQLNGPGVQCFYNVLENTFAHYGYQYSEAEIFFLLGHWNPAIRNDHEPNSISRLEFTSYEDLLRVACEILQMELRLCPPTEYPAFIRQSLEENYPVIMAVRPTTLTYQLVQINLLNIHFLLIDQFDCNTNHVCIWDGYVQDPTGYIDTFYGWYPLDKLLSEAQGCAVMTQHGWPTFINKRSISRKILTEFDRMLHVSPEYEPIGCQAILQFFDGIRTAHSRHAALDANLYSQCILSMKTRFIILYEYTYKILQQYHIGDDTVKDKLNNLKKRWLSLFLRMLVTEREYEFRQATEIADICRKIINSHHDLFTEVSALLTENLGGI